VIDTASRRSGRRLALLLASLALAGALCGCATSRATLESSAGSEVPPKVELGAVPFFAQERLQCGPAALATVLAAGGLEVTPAELEPLVYLPGRGGSLEIELVAATRRYDRMPYVLEPQLDDVVAEIAAGHPVLVLQNLRIESLPVWHFAVVVGYDVEHERVILRSGTTQRLEMSTHSFLRTWDLAHRWAMIVLEPGALPGRADAGSYIAAAAGLESAGRLEAAGRAYQRAARTWPQESLAWLGLGNVAYAQSDYPAAVAAYRNALAQSPADVVARNNLADALAHAGCMEAARTAIEEGLVRAAGTPFEARVRATADEIAQARAQDPSRCTANIDPR
jgi:Tetratricopeptide repeat/Peptidase_C39 like family